MIRFSPWTRYVAGLALTLALLARADALAKCNPSVDPDRTDIAEARAAVEGACHCDTATKHGDYVKCSTAVLKATLANQSCRGAAQRCAAQSTCGRSGYISCCRTDVHGKRKCSIKKNTAACKPPKGGTACAGNFKSCCDACADGDCTAGRCGDGLRENGEQCEPPGGTCTAGTKPGRCDAGCVCQPAVCGNNVQEPGEQCDDGNTASEDGCDASCQTERSAVPPDPVPGGQSLETDPDATPAIPLTASITSPVTSTMSLWVTSDTNPAPPGVQLIGKEVDISAPSATPDAPLVLVFQIDGSRIRSGETEQTIVVFRNGVAVPACLGDPGVAFPDPCVSLRELLPGGDVRLTVLSKAASVWQFGVQLCGNHLLDPGELCDPPGQQGQCGAGQVCTSSCQCAVPCDCCADNPLLLGFTTGLATGTCGTLQDNAGSPLMSLACGGLYFGGAGVGMPLPAPFPDQGQSLVKVACVPGTGTLAVTAAGSADTGSSRTCTKAGCSFGAPMPLPNPGSPATSVCLVNTISQDVTGQAACVGTASLNVPMKTTIYLTSDLLPDAGIQPCPLCKAGVCAGGPNDGNPCTPEDSASLGSAYPTSRDCPPPVGTLVGSLPGGYTLTTGTARATATDLPGQVNVFCGFCRNKITNQFKSPPVQCTADADCAGLGSFTSCGQHTAGAFTSTDVARTITVVGTPAACLAGGVSRAITLAGGTCMPPTYNSLVDSAADLPGPAALSLAGQIVLFNTTTTTSTTTTSTTTTTTSTTLPGGCACPGGAPSKLSLTMGIASGTCGRLDSDTTPNFFPLACGGLYFGGAGSAFPLPVTIPDMGQSLFLTSCTGSSLSVTAASAADTGSNRTCTKNGCLFGAPIASVNSSHSGGATSTCIVPTFNADAYGAFDCTTGAASNLSLPLGARLYLTGDLMLKRCSGGTAPGRGCNVNADCPGGTCVNDVGRCVNNGVACNSDSDCPASTCETGACVGGVNAGRGCISDAGCPASTCRTFIQSCPICNPTTGLCNGGPNDGLACSTGNSATGGAYPTSQDCPPSPLFDIGPIAFDLTVVTGTQSRTATNLPSQAAVFCGFCRNKITLAFRNPPFSCLSDADCVGGPGGTTSCGQHTGGAFTSIDLARTIVVTGSPAGSLTTGGIGHAIKLVATTCVPPTYTAIVDAAADLAGPGVITLTGQAQLLP
jgi:cysteine-rich repeat protein